MGFEREGSAKNAIDRTTDGVEMLSEQDRADFWEVEEAVAEQTGRVFILGVRKVPVDDASAYTCYSVALPKVGLQSEQHEKAGWVGT